MIEIIDHPGELEMRVTHATLEGLYGEALRGLAREIDAPGAGARRERRPVDIRSSGADTLLADLLNEAVYLIDVEGFVPDGLEDARVTGGALTGVLVGRRSADARALVKAATYNGLAVRRVPNGWEGRVVVDV
ncbi:MAG TPA: archease [Miltoncostaeaceae bacterium]|nr:archease [Miltoncostaeaceae bacterium]